MIGTWITIPDSTIAEILSLSKFDFFVIDMQHSIITLDKMMDIIRAIRTNSKSEIYVRIDINSFTINKCLDAGVDGIIIPNIETESQINEIIKFARYPPIGKRSVGLQRAQEYGLKLDEYYEISRRIKIIIQIESKVGYLNAERLLSMDIDGYILGPYDLSKDMDYTKEDVDEGKLKDVETRLIYIAKKHNKSAGYHIVHPNKELIDNKKKLGYNMIILGVDSIMLLDKSIEVYGIGKE